MEKDYVKFPNFSQNAANFPNSMGPGPILKRGVRGLGYTIKKWTWPVSGYSKAFANSEDPDEMQHYRIWVHCFLR